MDDIRLKGHCPDCGEARAAVRHIRCGDTRSAGNPPICSCSRGCRTKNDLRSNHGTPVQYRNALYRAYCDLYITYEEMNAAADKYLQAWNRALDGK